MSDVWATKSSVTRSKPKVAWLFAGVLSALLVTTHVSTAAGGEAQVGPATCSLSADDQAWLDRAVVAWQFAKREIANIDNIDNFNAVFFSADCVASSDNALVDHGTKVQWDYRAHDGTVVLPDGDEMPAHVTSFTSGGDDRVYFVMSTPSVWRAGGVRGGPLGLETLMVAVLLHEGSHVAQASTYGNRITALQNRYALPDSFGDDSLQHRFENDEQFSGSIQRETDLFFAAAEAPDDVEALRLARQARMMMLERADRWFTDSEAYWREAEDIWLTFEGAGQWVGFEWLVSDRGAAASRVDAKKGFARRSKWWSQNQGLAIVLVLERLAGASWKRHAFGDGEKTLLQMLDEALSAAPAL